MEQIPIASTVIASAPLATSSTREASRFLRTLYADLNKSLVPEMELTVKVAVLSAAGRTRQQIVQFLECSDIEVRMALIRLQRIAGEW